jgi:Pyruvate/2-oxoacid:ferredoxin oxidoreductase gamma subunit
MISHSHEEKSLPANDTREPAAAMVVDTSLPDTAEVLDRAATIAVAGGLALNVFMQAAFAAYLAANPRQREEIENFHARAHLEALRQRGGLPVA